MNKKQTINQMAKQAKGGSLKENEFIELMTFIRPDVKKMIHKWTLKTNASITRDDIYQLARIEIFYAVEKWDESRSEDFLRYALTRVKIRLIHETSEDSPIRVPYSTQSSKNGQKKIVVDSTNKYYGLKDEKELDTYIVEMIAKQSNDKILYESIDMLPLKERDILIRFYGLYDKEEESIMQIANDYGYTKQNVYRILHNALNDLKKALDATNFDY